MRLIFTFLLVFLLTSCDFFMVKKTSSQDILNEELNAFNWTDVDEYPSFSSCDSIKVKSDRKDCFQNSLAIHIWEFLKKEKITVTQDITDTIVLNFNLSKTGVLKLTDSKMATATRKEIPNIEALITQSLDSLPKIYPAIKRGQHVNAAFSLPIIINVN
ncbi:hypothetical protein PW52_00270 [Tamlana sedimentorum]|uniref:TonB C-terminal domain-containing protein n=1 Tax=Neotamlana sedimentorum TaxID=1435349 RepID=A0A0D7WCU1_9FLAO|nr:hypothetical protein [Tamlana sedimentorum]KJD36931.1 hypothetical protein PW52_00270 [Tamlana sedimentorum]